MARHNIRPKQTTVVFSKMSTKFLKKRSSRNSKTSQKQNNGTFTYHPVSSLLSPNMSKQVYPTRIQRDFSTVTRGPTENSAFQSYTFKGNSPLISGPQFNWAGAFSTNYPSGLAYVLGQNQAGGSTAPYGNFFCVAGSIQFILNTMSDNTFPIVCLVWPSKNPSFLTMSLTQLQEQPYVKRVILPCLQSTAQRSTISHSITTQQVMGLKYVASLERPDYCGNYVTDPTTLWYWHIVVGSEDNSTSSKWCSEVRLNHRLELFGVNDYSTTAPS